MAWNSHNGLENLTATMAYRKFRNSRNVHVYCDITTHDISYYMWKGNKRNINIHFINNSKSQAINVVSIETRL